MTVQRHRRDLGAINLVDGTIGTLTLTSARHGLDLGHRFRHPPCWISKSATASSPAIGLPSGRRTVLVNGGVINISTLPGGTVSAGTYNLITFQRGHRAGNLSLATTTLGSCTTSACTPPAARSS